MHLRPLARVAASSSRSFAPIVNAVRGTASIGGANEPSFSMMVDSYFDEVGWPLGKKKLHEVEHVAVFSGFFLEYSISVYKTPFFSLYPWYFFLSKKKNPHPSRSGRLGNLPTGLAMCYKSWKNAIQSSASSKQKRIKDSPLSPQFLLIFTLGLNKERKDRLRHPTNILLCS